MDKMGRLSTLMKILITYLKYYAAFWDLNKIANSQLN